MDFNLKDREFASDILRIDVVVTPF